MVVHQSQQFSKRVCFEAQLERQIAPKDHGAGAHELQCRRAFAVVCESGSESGAGPLPSTTPNSGDGSLERVANSVTPYVLDTEILDQT